MNAKELLARALDILDKGSAWVKFDNAVDDNDKFSPIHNKQSVKWDIYGALRKAHEESGNLNWREWQIAYEVAKKAIPPSFRNRDIEDWNDIGDFKTAISVYLEAGNLPDPDPDIEILVLGDELGQMFTTEDQITTISI